MRLLIATGIYPPEIGGSATYAKSLEEALVAEGHTVRIATFRIERRLPTGLRHLVFFCRVLVPLLRSDAAIALDSFSVAVPTVAAGRLLGKEVIIRIGGDVLWENWVERTGTLVPLDAFYGVPRMLTQKERLMKRLTRWALVHASGVVWNCAWVKDVFKRGYGLPEVVRSAIIENAYGPKEAGEEPHEKAYLAPARPIALKNSDRLKRAFARAQKKDPALSLDTALSSHDELIARLKRSYAVIVPSISEVYPNLALEAVRYGRPFICTRNTGAYERLKDVGLFVDPLDEEALTQAVLTLADPALYAEYRRRAVEFSFMHTYGEIAHEWLDFIRTL